jgi:hypothetical protein
MCASALCLWFYLRLRDMQSSHEARPEKRQEAREIGGVLWEPRTTYFQALDRGPRGWGSILCYSRRADREVRGRQVLYLPDDGDRAGNRRRRSSGPARSAHGRYGRARRSERHLWAGEGLQSGDRSCCGCLERRRTALRGCSAACGEVSRVGGQVQILPAVELQTIQLIGSHARLVSVERCSAALIARTGLILRWHLWYADSMHEVVAICPRRTSMYSSTPVLSTPIMYVCRRTIQASTRPHLETNKRYRR